MPTAPHGVSRAREGAVNVQATVVRPAGMHELGGTGPASELGPGIASVGQQGRVDGCRSSLGIDAVARKQRELIGLQQDAGKIGALWVIRIGSALCSLPDDGAGADAAIVVAADGDTAITAAGRGGGFWLDRHLACPPSEVRSHSASRHGLGHLRHGRAGASRGDAMAREQPVRSAHRQTLRDWHALRPRRAAVCSHGTARSETGCGLQGGGSRAP